MVRVLVVEDERKLAEVVSAALQSEHYDVVVARSGEDGFYRASAELFDPRTERFEEIAPMTTARRPYGVITLPDGRLLIAGGTTGGKVVTAAAEIYDPSLGRFESVSARPRPGRSMRPRGCRTVGSSSSVGIETRTAMG